MHRAAARRIGPRRSSGRPPVGAASTVEAVNRRVLASGREHGTLGKQKITSPGILLIAVCVCSGGIFLLDRFALEPQVDSERQAALQEQALRAESAARAVIASRREALATACSAWASRATLARLPEGQPGREAFSAFGASALAKGGVDFALIGRAGEPPDLAWSRKGEGPQQGGRAVVELPSPPESGDSAAGLMRVGSEAALVAGHPLEGPQGRRLWVGQYLDADLLDAAGKAAGGTLVRVADTRLPQGMSDGSNRSQTMWTADGDTLAVAWPMRDASGEPFGYLRADIPSGHVRRQAELAQRNATIVLVLSTGLCALIVVAVHVLIAGPVIRLLGRIQRMESGEETVDDLTRDLHGEPRILARRLESTFEKLASMSKRDQLTGLANRRHFEQVLDAFYHQARRYNRPLSLIMLDIDFFKAINDAGGHHAGDELLKDVAAAIEKICRKADLPARLGGDEFAILLPETPADKAAAMAERVRSEISMRTVMVRGTEANVTSSVGIADLNAGEIDSPDGMLSLADRAMYASKDKGRNRIFQAHDLDGCSLSGEAAGGGDMDVLSKKLIGLDTQFKDMFVQGLEEIMEILAHRDPHMAAHARKVQHYAVQIAHEMELPDRVIKRLRIGAMLHDIGMLAMPDSVLLCETRLDEGQLRLMRRHPLLSVRIMEGMEFLEQEIPTVRYHHENYDGSGYPEGLAGAAIPLTARILAVADAFDAMTSPRTFRSAKSISEALSELRKGVGVQFDPAVVEAFVNVAGRLGERLTEVQASDREEHPDEPEAPADGAEAVAAGNS